MSDEVAKADENQAILQKLSEIAVLAGVKGKIEDNGERFVAGYGFDDGRSQMVYARPIKTPSGAGVCVYSPAAKYKKGMFGSISKEAAVDLLMRNENLYFARYGIRKFEDELLVVASVDLLIDTLDPEELRSAMGSVSAAADTWEEKAGKGDDF